MKLNKPVIIPNNETSVRSGGVWSLCATLILYFIVSVFIGIFFRCQSKNSVKVVKYHHFPEVSKKLSGIYVGCDCVCLKDSLKLP